MMNRVRQTCLSTILAGCLLFFPLYDAQADGSASQPATLPEAKAPLQEEMQYLTASQLAEEENLLAILWVQRSAEFRGLSYQAYNMAAMEVDQAVTQRRKEEIALHKTRAKTNVTSKQNPLRPLAVVLDIDDTIVCHAPLEFYYLEHPEAKTNYKTWEQWIAQYNEPLPGARDFLKHADKLGVQVFYVTGRGPQDKDVTVRFLQNTGLPFIDETHLLMNDRSGSKMNHFAKLARRYDIICYLGDNVADFPIGAFRDENAIQYLKTADNNSKNASVSSCSGVKDAKKNDIKINRPIPLDIPAMLKHDKNKKRNAIIDTHKDSFGTKFILLPNPMYGDWEYNLAKKYRKLPAEQRIALRKAAMKSFTYKEK
jgi:predicted secreted acid phosphatase